MPELSFTACTVATCAQYPATRVLAKSFAAAHPGVRFLTLLVDADPAGLPPEVLTPERIGVSDAELARLAPSLTADQACAVLLPRLLLALLTATGKPVLHLGASSLVLADLTEPFARAMTNDSLASLAVVPRTLRPLPDDDRQPTSAQLHAAGVYEPAVLAVAEGAEPFLREWADAAVRDPAAANAFLDGAPAMVEHRVLRDPGIGLSYWNAAQRPLAGTAGALSACGVPLRTVHFDGFDPAKPWLYTGDLHRPRVLLSENSLLNGLCQRYRDELAAPVSPPRHGRRFGMLEDGTVVPASLREQARAAGPVADVERWLCARWQDALWADDPDLRHRFPDPNGADRAAYRQWCLTEGVAKGRLPLAAVRDEDTTELQDHLGVTVLGSGPIAESMRLAVTASGLPHADEPIYPVVLCVADVPVGVDRYLVAVRAEPEPDSRADEVWTPVQLPFPLDDPGERDDRDRLGARERLGLGEETVFVALLDHAAGADGGAVTLVQAFGEAFADRTDARLVVHATPAPDPDSAERTRLAAAGDPRVRLIDGPPDTDAVLAADWLVCWQREESPGSGAVLLDLAAAAARGVPVIAREDGVAADLLDGDSAVMARETELADVLRELVDDHGAAAKLGGTVRDRMLAAFNPVAAGEVLRGRVERAFRTWRARHTIDEPEPERDPLQPLRAVRHALLREPDVAVGHKIPMAPALRKAVLRVLNHYDAHLRTVLHTMLDGVERSTAELAAAQKSPVDLDALRTELDQSERVQAGEDAVLRLRADLVAHDRNLTSLTTAIADESVTRHAEFAAMSQRMDELTALLEATTSRIDTVEQGVSARFAERDAYSAGQLRSATQALQATDALRRVVVRAHERSAELDGDLDGIGTPTALVLCDAGLIRLPAEDSMMLPVLSSNGVWEPALAELIDSLIEPDGVFLDVGAYVGYHCLRVLSRLGTSGAVVAVEPDPIAANLVRHNVSANVSNAVADRLAVVRAAAWDIETGLTTVPALGGGVTVSAPAPDSDGTHVTTTSSSESGPKGVRLDRELESTGVLRGLPLSVVKLDVPGRTDRAFGGLVRLLRRDRPQVLCTFAGPLISEIGGIADAPDAVLGEVGRLGYDVVPLGSSTSISPAEGVAAVRSGELSTLWLRPRASR